MLVQLLLSPSLPVPLHRATPELFPEPRAFRCSFGFCGTFCFQPEQPWPLRSERGAGIFLSFLSTLRAV